MSESRRPALGRGLEALIPGASAFQNSSGPSDGSPHRLPTSQVRASLNQPRRYFDEKALGQLADSISENGILQPIVVRRVAEDDYVIIAGERRFRAAQRAGLLDVPVVIREATDAEAFELALVENIQRQDLNPMEESEAYHHLVDAYGMTQEQIARRVGKDRTTVSNALRLLKLPAEVRDLVRQGIISAGHARAVMTVKDPDQRAQFAGLLAGRGWSVRETERRAREVRKGIPVDLSWDDMLPGTDTPSEPPPVPFDAAEPEGLSTPADDDEQHTATRSPADEAVEAELRGVLGAPVRLVHRAGKGRVEIRFHSLDELERLLDMFRRLEEF